MAINRTLDPQSQDEIYVVRLTNTEIANMSHHTVQRVVELVAQKIAGEYLVAHGPEVLAQLNPMAIATMAVAEAGAAVNETLHKKMPDKIVTIEVSADPVVLQRGIFGGVMRLRDH